MLVTKADGRKEPFDKEKVVNTCIRSRVPKKKAMEIASDIEKNGYDGIPTGKIYEMVLGHLEKQRPLSGFYYRVRQSIADLDPESFELFVLKILKLHDYNCIWNKIIQGACIEHQVDIIAENSSGVYLVECKRHYNPHRFCGLGTSLQVQARLEDIEDGYRQKKSKYNFTNAWIVTNTKFSEHAIKYSTAKEIALTGWSYPEKSLERMTEESRAFPVTILKVDNSVKKALLSRKIITVLDILQLSPKKLRHLCNLEKYELKNITEQASILVRKK